MHKFLFFLFFFVNGITGKSQTSRLVFYSENGETFQIEMDGKLYNQIPSYYIKLENTSPGKHVFTLSFSEKGNAGTFKGNFTLQRADYGIGKAGGSIGDTVSIELEVPVTK